MTPSRRMHPPIPLFMPLLVLALLVLATPLARPADAAALCDDRYEIKGDPDMPEMPDPVYTGRTGTQRRVTFTEIRFPRTPPPTLTLLSYIARWSVFAPR